MGLSRILVVGKEPELYQLAQQVGREIFAADSPVDAFELTKTINPELILFDHRFGPNQFRELLDAADKNSKNVTAAVVGDNDNSADAAEFIRLGACEYLRGKQDYIRLEQLVSRIKSKPDQTQSQDDMRRFFAEDYAACVPNSRSQQSNH